MPTDPDEGTYAYLLDDDTLARLPRIRRTPGGEVEFRKADPDGITRPYVEPIPRPTPVEAAARDYFAGDYRPPGTAGPQEHDGPLTAFRAGWHYAAEELREGRDEAVADADRYANALTSLEQERDEARRQVVEQGEAAEEQADALRAEVARLSGLLDEVSVHRDSLIAANGRQAETIREQRQAGPLGDDPRRPRLDHFPDDAILLTYRELRQLVGLHLEACATAVAPADSARAMRDGETGLRLHEVLDR
jgi:hypothetical protein